jgi:hypothetical protein
MPKAKRKIYRITLWIYSDDAKVDIDEFHIKRKGEESIQTEEGEVLYCHMLNRPSSGVILGENYIDVTMLTEDIRNLDEAIKIMVEDGRRVINEQIKDFNSMQSELDHLGKYEREIFMTSKDKGYLHIKKEEDEIVAIPFRVDIEPIKMKDFT